MASLKKSNLDLINDCDSFPYDPTTPTSYYKFLLASDRRPHGYMLPSTVTSMPWTPDFHIDHAAKTVRLLPSSSPPSSSSSSSAEALTAALTRQTDAAIAADTYAIIHAQHSERYPIPGAPLGVTIERYFAPLFGTISRGAHLTVYTYVSSDSASGSGGEEGSASTGGKELRIWVPRRSATCFTYPNCLDTTVAGGLPAGETALGCIVREAAEEASLDPQMVRARARATGVLSYMSFSGSGDGGELGLVAPDLVFVFDLEVKEEEGVVCRPSDGEVGGFELLGVREVVGSLSRGEWKTNSAVVMLDFLVRHGVVHEGNEKDYVECVGRMHRRLPFPTRPE